MKDEDFNNIFEKVSNSVNNIYNAFYLWKNLQNSKYNIIYNKYKYFWGITISGVQLFWLLGIPKLSIVSENVTLKGSKLVSENVTFKAKK